MRTIRGISLRVIPTAITRTRKNSNKGETKSEGMSKKKGRLQRKRNFEVQPLKPEDDAFVSQATGMDGKTVKKMRASMCA